MVNLGDSTGIDSTIGASVLFYRGELPPGEELTLEIHRFSYPIKTFLNQTTGVVMLYSKGGVPHVKLSTLVPRGSKILGGIRFSPDKNEYSSFRHQMPASGNETLYVVNSTSFSYRDGYDGIEVLLQNFHLSFQ